MSFVTKALLRLRNFKDYTREFGLRGAISLVRQRAGESGLHAIPVRGFNTPIYCRPGGSDFAVLRQVIGHQDAAVQLDRPPTLIIDAGANVGYSSLIFARNYPGATIVGIEPDASNCEMFRKNCSSYPNIRLLEGALWPRTAMLAIKNPNAHAFEFQVGETDSAGEDSVRAYTIPEIIELNGGGRVGLLKIDIEGAEKPLFEQNTEWLGKIDVMMIELHDRYVSGCTDAMNALLANVKHTREPRGEYVCVRLEHQP